MIAGKTTYRMFPLILSGERIEHAALEGLQRPLRAR
jgi:hypothetical protein